MYCTKCGSSLPEGTQFCTVCGARQNEALAVVPNGSQRSRSRWLKIVIAAAIVVIIASVAAIAIMLGQKDGDDSHGSASASSEAIGSSDADDSTSSVAESDKSPSLESPVEREKDAWYGSTVEIDGKTRLASLEGIEGTYIDRRNGPTEKSGYYAMFRLSDAKVSEDGMSGTCSLEMNWLPETGKPVKGGVAQFKATVSVSFDPAHPDTLSCSVDNQEGTLKGKATLTEKAFSWTEGTMTPQYESNSSETVKLTRKLERES